MPFEGVHGIIGRRYVAPSSPFPLCAGRALAERDCAPYCWAFPDNTLGLPTSRYTNGTIMSAGDGLSARGEQTCSRRWFVFIGWGWGGGELYFTSVGWGRSGLSSSWLHLIDEIQPNANESHLIKLFTQDKGGKNMQLCSEISFDLFAIWMVGFDLIVASGDSVWLLLLIEMIVDVPNDWWPSSWHWSENINMPPAYLLWFFSSDLSSFNLFFKLAIANLYM